MNKSPVFYGQTQDNDYTAVRMYYYMQQTNGNKANKVYTIEFFHVNGWVTWAKYEDEKSAADAWLILTGKTANFGQ